MLGPNKLSEIANQVFSFSKADQIEVIISHTESALTRFANNQIHQNVAESNAQVRVRVVYGKKIGVASSNDLSPDALKRIVETARAIAQQCGASFAMRDYRHALVSIRVNKSERITNSQPHYNARRGSKSIGFRVTPL